MQPHDRINLLRLIRRLESPSTAPSTSETDPYAAWLRARSQQQRVAHARQLWKGLMAGGETGELDELDSRIDTLEKLAAKSCDENPAPIPPRTTFLESLPLSQPIIPPSPSASLNPPSTMIPSPPTAPSTPIPPMESEPTSPVPLASSLIPSTFLPDFPFPAQAPAPVKSPEAEYTMNAVQSELTDQLSQLSHQLKLNAVHFSERLAADAGIVKAAEGALETNLDRMRKERGRLKDYAGKAGGTTWLVLGSVAVVMTAWVVMFLVIRIT